MILLKHTKVGSAKYLGHLDLLRSFKRIFNRAEISIEKSQGFNPHPLFFFPQPLGLGIESECELVVVGANYENNILNRLNNVTIPGVKFIECVEIEKNINLAANIVSSKFLIEIENFDDIKKDIEEILKEKELFISLKTKSGEKERDVKDMIYSYEFANNGMVMELSCGNNNLRPDYLMIAISNLIKKEFYYKCKRIEAFIKKDEKKVSCNSYFKI